MPNLILCAKGKEEVTHFVENAIKKGNDVFGDNIKLSGVKEKTWDFIWTDDVLKEIKIEDTISYAEKRSDVTSIERKRIIHTISKTDIKNLVDLADSKTKLTEEEQDFYIKSLTKALLTLLKIKKT